MTILVVIALMMAIAMVAVIIAVVIKWLSEDFGKKSKFEKKLKIGQRVAVIAFSFNKNRDEFKTGNVVAIKAQMIGVERARPYAVRFDDGGIDLFSAENIYTEWGEE